MIAPDLRGHGESTEIDRGGSDREARRPRRLKTADVADMVEVRPGGGEIVSACEKNNAGELNIDKLCVVGAEMGAIVAARLGACSTGAGRS